MKLSSLSMIVLITITIAATALALSACATANPTAAQLPAATQTTASKAASDATAQSSGGQPALTTNGPVTLHVFAAASLADAFAYLANRFQAKYPDVTVELSAAGSQQLANQINEGAPADVFASANLKQMETVIQGGRVTAAAQHIFAGNMLVIVTPSANPAKLKTMQDLTRAGVKLVLAAEEVPAGQYTQTMLKQADQNASLGSGFSQAVQKNVISYEENIRAVLNKVILGEADAGIVYMSDLFAGGADQLGRIEIPRSLNIAVEYPIAVLKDTPQPAVAQAFVDYILSEEGQQILARYGFLATQ